MKLINSVNIRGKIWIRSPTKKLPFVLLSMKRYLVTTLSPSQPAITCSKLTIETVEQGVKYVQS